MEDGGAEPLNSTAATAHDRGELQTFTAWLRWLCLDQSTAWTVCLSWFVFVALAILVPAFSHFALGCSGGYCDGVHRRPYEAVVQLSLSTVAALSFVCLSRFVSKYGLRRFLFFDKLCDESEIVRKGYTNQFNRSMKVLFIFVLPCFAAETAYKIWWYSSGGMQIPFLWNVVVSCIIACILELCSWFYRTMVFFLVCILFRLICCLQILRLQDFAQVFLVDSDVESILREHLRIRKHLQIISHRYRLFILWALILITASLLASLLMTTRSNQDVYIHHTGELVVCSVSLIAGLMILLRSATRITHKAQGVVSLAAKWHACATIDSFDATIAEEESPNAPMDDQHDDHHQEPISTASSAGSFDLGDVGDEEDEMHATVFVPSYAYSTMSYQRRQALVTYFENNRAGITIYGFMLDRTSLDTIFGLELTLVLWLLGQTVGMPLNE